MNDFLKSDSMRSKREKPCLKEDLKEIPAWVGDTQHGVKWRNKITVPEPENKNSKFVF